MQCVGCAGEFPEADGPVHGYMLSAPGCWAMYGQVLASEYGDPHRMRLHRLTVDAYAVQHAGANVLSARRSVGIHLMRLHLLLECGWAIERVNQATPLIAEARDRCEWLEPPLMAGTLNVTDVVGAESVEEHELRVRAWAESAWAAWEPHHRVVQRWADGI